MDFPPQTAIRRDRLDHEAAILDTILGSTDYGVLLTDLDHISVACNPRFGELFGVSHHLVVARLPHEVRQMVSHRIPRMDEWSLNLEAVYSDPERIQTDCLELVSPRQWLRRVTRPVRDEEGRVVGRLWTFLDVTESTYREKTRDLLFQISQMVDPDPGHVYREIVEAIGGFYGSLCLLSTREPGFLAFRAVGGPESPARTLPGNNLSDSFCQFCLDVEAPMVIQDARSHPKARETLPALMGLTRYLGVPVRLPSGELVGTLCILDSRSEEQFSEADIELLSLCATRIAAELHREESIDERVRQARQRRADQEIALQLTQSALRAILHSASRVQDSFSLEEACHALAESLDGFGGLRVKSITAGKSACLCPGLALDLPEGYEGRLHLEEEGCPPAAREVYRPALARHVSLVLSGHILRGRLERSSAELQSAQTQIVNQEKLAVSGAMAATIAHDIRNILAAIAFDLAGDPTPEAWKRLRVQIERFQVLNHRLLVYAKPRTGLRRPVPLAPLVAGCLALIEPLASASRVALKVLVEAPVEVLGDDSQLEHLVVNLILNAIEAMEGKGGEVAVTVTAEDTEGVLRVKDSGPGIAPSVRASLFEPFVTSRRTGFGLGLFSCRRIVKEHGGGLELIETSPEGTVFEARLPLS